MSKVDENGTVHPTEEDPWSIEAQAHFAFCRECNRYALPKQDKLLSPCHNAPIYIFIAGYDEDPRACCPECHNEWNSDGDLI